LDDPGVEGVAVVGSLDSALHTARSAIERGEWGGPVWIAGGGTIYTQMLDHAELVVRTLVECEVEGDAAFPAWIRMCGE
jgi:dihydrofolate reductase